MSESERYLEFLAELRREFPKFRIVDKSRSSLSAVIDRLLRMVTFGKANAYLTSYHTTLGSAVYVTDSWHRMSDDDRILLLRHERVHMRQFRRFTPPIMAIGYLFLPLPLGFSYFRAWCEMEAYAETIRATAELRGKSTVEEQAFREWVISQFLGPAYGWMWPFRRSLNRWYDGILREIL